MIYTALRESVIVVLTDELILMLLVPIDILGLDQTYLTQWALSNTVFLPRTPRHHDHFDFPVFNCTNMEAERTCKRVR
jgi:hypothetical protein